MKMIISDRNDTSIQVVKFQYIDIQQAPAGRRALDMRSIK